MSADNTNGPDIGALRRLLDVYGGDTKRWPREATRRFAPLLASDGQARAALAEARALDAALATTPTISPDRLRRLADRIVQDALAQGAAVQSRHDTGRIIDLAATRRTTQHPPSVRANNRWQATGLLAASLLIGVFAGVSGSAGVAFDDIAALIGLAGESEPLITAFELGFDSAIDEETL